MIVITVRFKVKPEHVDGWLDRVESFTRNTRAEEGNLWFDWARSVDDPNEFILLEAFKDDGAEAHVGSDHFKQAIVDLPPALAETPRIINFQTDGDDWSEMGEMKI
ncbi:putative quinol monooxygenase [Solicola sp. PLA-1-18]|uniref:putative quinol monooxygenase n=1 Tax=Solicola sp. PLA-1-18 TaxID=3380532 RepID=UPI003B7CACFD